MTPPRLPLSLTAAAFAAMLALSSCGTQENAGAQQEQGAQEDTGVPNGATIPGPSVQPTEEGEATGDSQVDVDGAPADAETGESGENDSTATGQDWPASNTTTMGAETTISEPVISPKSIVSSDHGLAIANNMMYQNTVTIYDTQSQQLVQELSDRISPAEFGASGYPDSVVGAPVEAVWTEDGQYAYVSQYRLEDMGAGAYDDCRNGDAVAPSAVYRYSVAAEDWDQFIEVGRVPKFVELTPDGSKLLVSNWCDADVSVVDTETGQEINRVPVNSQPRGIAALPDNRTVFVAAMYANELYRLDLETGEQEVIYSQGEFPRHLSLSPDAQTLYVTFAHSDLLVAFDTETNEVLRSTNTGREPRSMDISADGSALYVVNYFEDTVSKFDATTFEEIDRQPTGYLPIGVTYDPVTASVWVANYSGTISIFDDHSAAR